MRRRQLLSPRLAAYKNSCGVGGGWAGVKAAGRRHSTRRQELAVGDCSTETSQPHTTAPPTRQPLLPGLLHPPGPNPGRDEVCGRGAAVRGPSQPPPALYPPGLAAQLPATQYAYATHRDPVFVVLGHKLRHQSLDAQQVAHYLRRHKGVGRGGEGWGAMAWGELLRRARRRGTRTGQQLRRAWQRPVRWPGGH